MMSKNVQPQTAPDLRVGPYMTAASFSTNPASFNTEPLPALKRTFPSKCSAASKQAARAKGGAGTPARDHPWSGPWPFSSTDTAAFTAVVRAVMYGPGSFEVDKVPAPPCTATAQCPAGFVVMWMLSKKSLKRRRNVEAQLLGNFCETQWKYGNKSTVESLSYHKTHLMSKLTKLSKTFSKICLTIIVMILTIMMIVNRYKTGLESFRQITDSYGFASVTVSTDPSILDNLIMYIDNLLYQIKFGMHRHLGYCRNNGMALRAYHLASACMILPIRDLGQMPRTALT